jgi:hypothetical protein
MAEINNSIALQTQTPNPTQTLGSFLNVAGAAQQVKQGQMDLQERNALRGLSENLDKYKTPDGGLDFKSLVNDASQAAPKLGSQWAQQIAASHVQGLAVDKSLSELSEQQRGIMGRTVESVAGQPFDVQQKIIGSVVNANPKLGVWGDMAIQHLKSSWDAGGADAAKQTAFQIAKGTLGVPEQNQLNTPNLVQSSDQAGNPVYRNINPMAQAQGEAMPSGPRLGVAQNVSDLQREVTAIRQAGDQAPAQRNINQNILRLSRDTTTGPGSQYWQKGLAAAGLGQYGDNYQELGKFLEKNAIQNMQAMGGAPSDARLSAASAANGSTEFNPGALQMVTKFNDATTSAVDKYRQGIDKVVGIENPNFGAAAKFKSEWAKNLDIDVFRIENAVRDGDKEELSRITKELGPAKLKLLAQKRKNLESLANTGKIQ